MIFKPSELILNPDGSIYHLNLLPHQIADTIITVGDPDRVPLVTSFFDTIEYTVKKREFHTQTGTYKGKRITVISTGIGTDNIDIVLNELDALANINFNTRTLHPSLKQLTIIRIGTSGAIQKNIPINSFLISEKAIGFDNLLHFYNSNHIQDLSFSKALIAHTSWDTQKSQPYVVNCSTNLLQHFHSSKTLKGVTVTNVGFYGPQSRQLRAPLKSSTLHTKLTSFLYNNQRITNLEMETSGIYGLSKLLGHNALSLNAILANRVTGEFSKTPQNTINALIQYTLEKLM